MHLGGLNRKNTPANISLSLSTNPRRMGCGHNLDGLALTPNFMA
jgi:hypothetical protein